MWWAAIIDEDGLAIDFLVRMWLAELPAGRDFEWIACMLVDVRVFITVCGLSMSSDRTAVMVYGLSMSYFF